MPPPPVPSRPLFGTVLCGVDETPASLEAVRQAAILAGPAGNLRLTTVRWEGDGESTRRQVARVLEQAGEVARAFGVDPHVTSEVGAEPAEQLLLEAAGSDLVVVGDHGRPRSSAIAIASTALSLAHRSVVPVLIARHPWREVAFPGPILVAAAGDDDAAAARLAGRLAALHGSPVTSVSADAPEALPAAVAAAAARGAGAGLVITSGRALPASAVRRGVAERIAAAAPCSVLVGRTPARRCG